MNNKTMGNTIADLRKARGMTQLELANEMHVTDKAVSKWERNLSCPDIHTIPKLAICLGVSVEELMQGNPEPEKQVTTEAKRIFALVCKAVPLAMGIAVTVLSILGELQMKDGLVMLGVGLACVGISLLQER